MKILPFLESDLDQIRELQPADWGDIQGPFRNHLEKIYCYPIKIVADAKIVGLGCRIMHGDTVWLAHIIVHPDYRNQGIGKVITQTLIEYTDSSHYKTIYLIATELGAFVYEKLGFETETWYHFFKKPEGVPALLISPQIIPFEERHRLEMMALDQHVSGEFRDFRLDEFLPNAFVYEIEGKLEGYYFPSFGDGIIIANRPEAGIDLMKLMIQTHEIVSLPVDNQPAIEFLLSLGFSEIKKAKRMRLGLNRPWQPTKMFNRVSGQIG